MSDIKNPYDSLRDYFDELLPSEDVAAIQSEYQEKRSIPTTPKKPIITQTSSAKKAAPSVAAEFAEPDVEKKEKLQKLLSSATPKIISLPKIAEKAATIIAPSISPTSTFVADPNEIQEWVVETPVVNLQMPAADIKPHSLADSKPHVTQAISERSDSITEVEWLANGLPSWAQSRFDVLLFQVAGLTLAVPLISLGQIQPITDELTPLFGQADWFMGLQPTPQGKIRTVNTAKFVMPERYQDSFLKNAKYVMSINGVPWGLAVDSVNQPIRLDLDEVKWRTDRSKRPWLAGTLKSHMCALLDIPMIGKILTSADKNAGKSAR